MQDSPLILEKKLGLLQESTNVLTGAKAVNSLGFVGQEVRIPNLSTIRPHQRLKTIFSNQVIPKKKKKKGGRLNLAPGL